MLLGVQCHVLLDLGIVLLFRFQLQRGRFVVERVRRVRVKKQLGKEGVKDVDEVVHGRPGLVYHVQAHAS